jgi:outer membrane protein OmpA-like peptidoglycan-associated protein
MCNKTYNKRYNWFGQAKVFWLRPVVLCALFCGVAAVSAQAQHEFSVVGGGGLSTLPSGLSQGTREAGFGGSLGVGYSYHLSPHWSVVTGAEALLLRAGVRAFDLHDNYPANDGAVDFEFRYTARNFREQQQSLMAVIPLMLRYHAGRTGRYYAALGGKIGLPLSSRSEVRVDGFETRGYYPDWNVELNEPAFMGFGAFAGVSADETLPLKTAFLLSAEAGVKWPLGAGHLYTGISFDYGLNNIAGAPQERSLPYRADNPPAFQPHSLLASSAGATGAYTDKVIPLAAGVRVRWAFDTKQGKRQGHIREEEVAQAAETLRREEEAVPLTEARQAAQEEAQQEAQEEAQQAAQEEAQQAAQEEAQQEAQEEAQQAAQEKEQQAMQEKEKQVAEEQAQQAAEVRRAEVALQEAQQQHAAALAEVQQPIGDYMINQTNLQDSAKAILDRKIPLLQAYPQWRLLIEGHTCSLGTHAVNLRIGQRRADAAKAYLVERGIDPARIQTVSKAETEPVAPNTNEANRQKNRRVEFIIE